MRKDQDGFLLRYCDQQYLAKGMLIVTPQLDQNSRAVPMYHPNTFLNTPDERSARCCYSGGHTISRPRPVHGDLQSCKIKLNQVPGTTLASISTARRRGEASPASRSRTNSAANFSRKSVSRLIPAAVSHRGRSSSFLCWRAYRSTCRMFAACRLLSLGFYITVHVAKLIRDSREGGSLDS